MGISTEHTLMSCCILFCMSRMTICYCASVGMTKTLSRMNVSEGMITRRNSQGANKKYQSWERKYLTKTRKQSDAWLYELKKYYSLIFIPMFIFPFLLVCVALVLSIVMFFIRLTEYISWVGEIYGVLFFMIATWANYILMRTVIDKYKEESKEERCDVQLDLESEPVVFDRLENWEVKKFKWRPRKHEFPDFLMNEDERKKARKRKLARILYANSPIEKRKKLSKHRLKKDVAIK